MKQHVDGIIRNIGQLVTLDGPPVPRCGPAMQALGIIEDAAVAMQRGRITAAGPEQDIVAAFEASASETFDAEGGVVLPGFVDPHTHVLFAGSRWREFELRCQGRSYREIAAAGEGSAPACAPFAPRPIRS